jgi:hypothetical protein
LTFSKAKGSKKLKLPTGYLFQKKLNQAYLAFSKAKWQPCCLQSAIHYGAQLMQSVFSAETLVTQARLSTK